MSPEQRDELIHLVHVKVGSRRPAVAIVDGGIHLGDGRLLAIVEPATTPTDVGEVGEVRYCDTHDSPGVWFSDGSGGCMLEQIVEARWDTHYHRPLFRLVSSDQGETDG